ncbi:MAG: pyridoxal-dependent decarboxylase [Chloroflexota bacterium]
MDNVDKCDDWQSGTGDMPADVFREHGYRLVDWVASYLDNSERYPVLSRVQPGEIRSLLPQQAPDMPESMEIILKDFEDILMPGITHWNHPAFFAYFAISASAPGILAELLSAALNVNAMLWRTSPAASELEETTLDWLRQLVGLPCEFEGVIYDTASISSLVAIAAVREALGVDIRRRGMAGRQDLPRLRLYCSEQAHSSIEKGAIALGIGQQGVRKIPVDDEFRMDVRELESAIVADIAGGWKPFCVVATVGTTSTTSVDPVGDIAQVAGEYDVWLHVDAAYGGIAATLPELKWVLDGADRADSIVMNPHKWLFTPIDLSAFFCRRLEVVKDAFSLVPDYLRTPEGDGVRDYMNYGPQLGRRFRALKLWFILRAYGREGIAVRLREHIRLAHLFEGWVRDEPNWELMAPAPFSTICFRAHPPGVEGGALDRLNLHIEETVNAGGEVFLSHTVLRGAITLRLAVGNMHTEQRHIARAWELLRKAATGAE